VGLLLRELPPRSALVAVLKSSADASAVATLLEFLRVARDAYAALEANLGRHALTDAKWALLMQLYTEPTGRLLPSALAARLLVTRGAVSGLVRGSERAGLVCRVKHPSDQRKYYVALAPPGRRLIARVLPGHARRIVAYIGVLSSAERRSFTRALQKLYTSLPLLAAGGTHSLEAMGLGRRNRTSRRIG
jgi:DNA-binding MarR family transcriptional regulator